MLFAPNENKTKMAATELARQGWHLSGDGITKCCDEAKTQRSDLIIKRALDVDLKEIGSKWLPEDINKGRVDCLEGPAVLQLSKLRVVSAPKDNEESQTAPRLCRVSLTDGRTTCYGVTLEAIKGVGPTTPPGSKILLSGPVEVESNFLLLTNKNVKFLGGNVDCLASAWELKKTLAQQTLIRNKMQEGGPPPFVPFGSKINRNEPIPPKPKKDFKSLVSDKDKDPSAEDDKFLQQRQATIQQALQAKTSGQGVKTSFGGGQKQLVKDKDLARIVEMGFSAQDATGALKHCGGDVQEAINCLVSGPQHGMGGRFPDRGRPISGPREREGRGERDGRGDREGRGDRRRGNRDQREDDYEDDYVNRPSGPATLFDFIEAKLLSKDSGKTDSKSSTTTSKQPAPSSTSSTTATTTTTASSNHTSSKYASAGSQEIPVFKHTKAGDGRPNTSQGFSSSSNDSSSKYHNNNNRPTSNYNQRNGGSGGDYGGRSSSGKGHSEFGYGGEEGMDRRQHTTLPPRFAKQRTESSYNRDVEDHDGGRHRGHQDSRQPLLENNQQGRYNKNYPSNPSHPTPDYQGRNRGPSHSNPNYNKNADSYSNTPYTDSNPPKDHYNNSRKENTSNNPNTSSSQSHHHQQQQQRYPNHQQQQPHYNNRNQGQDYEGASGDRYHPADRGGSYNSRNGTNSSQDYRHQYQDNHHHHQQQPYHHHNQQQQQPPPRHAAGRAPPYNNQKPRMDNRRFPDDDGPFQVGDMVMAKYWEDNKYYRAVVCAIGPPGTTVLVQFMDYGNEEDVLISDVRHMQGQGHMGGGGGGGQWGYNQHSSGGGNMSRGGEFEPHAFVDNSHFVPPMQFTRGGQGSYGKGNGPRKPTQSFYSPPSMKH